MVKLMVISLTTSLTTSVPSTTALTPASYHLASSTGINLAHSGKIQLDAGSTLKELNICRGDQII